MLSYRDSHGNRPLYGCCVLYVDYNLNNCKLQETLPDGHSYDRLLIVGVYGLLNITIYVELSIIIIIIINEKIKVA